MSKGIKGAIAGLALLGLGVFLCASPASAQGTDNLDPSPVGEVLAEFNEGGRSITVAWTLSDDDVERQVPTSSDFTTGGTFIKVNDVTRYEIWRRLVDGSGLERVHIAHAGETSHVDDSIDVSEGSKQYVYIVLVVDDSDRRSTAIESDEVKNMLVTGDFDYNGRVDRDDYDIFKANFDQSDPDHPATDMDGNGVVDLEDFFLWADNLGKNLYLDQ